MKYCSILGPPRPNLEKGAGTRLPAAFSRKLGPVLERQLTPERRSPCRRGQREKSQKINESRSCVLRGIFWPLNALPSDIGSRMGPKGSQNGAKMEPKWLQKGSPIEWSISNPFLVPFFNDFGPVLKWFFYAVLDRRIMCMKNANVQNHPIFAVDFKDFTVAMKSEKQQKIYEKLC